MIDRTEYDESLGDPLRVTVIATGLSSSSRAESRPPTLNVVQPAAVALCTGTDKLPILNQPVQPPAAAEDTNMNTPSVWRNERSQAAAKVEASASSSTRSTCLPGATSPFPHAPVSTPCMTLERAEATAVTCAADGAKTVWTERSAEAGAAVGLGQSAR